MDQKICYKFIKLDLTQFATFEEQYVNDEKPIELSSSFQFSYDFENDVVCCKTSIVLTKATGPILKAELNSFFALMKESVNSISSNGFIKLPVELMTQFASLGYGTMRGVTYAKTIGTPLEEIVLPPNDIHKIFTSPAEFRK